MSQLPDFVARKKQGAAYVNHCLLMVDYVFVLNDGTKLVRQDTKDRQKRRVLITFVISAAVSEGSEPMERTFVASGVECALKKL